MAGSVPIRMYDLGLTRNGVEAEADTNPAESDHKDDERDALPGGGGGRVEAGVLREPAVQLMHVARGLLPREPPFLVGRWEAIVGVVGHDVGVGRESG